MLAQVRYEDITERNVDPVDSKPAPAVITEYGVITHVTEKYLYLARDMHDDGAGKVTVIPIGSVVDVRRLKIGSKVSVQFTE